LFSKSRASFLGVIIGLIVFVLVSVRVKTIYKYLITATLSGSFFIFIYFFAASLRSITSRFFLWEGAIKLIPQNPIFGSGLDTLKLVLQRVASP
jgi:O-antigen ligase